MELKTKTRGFTFVELVLGMMVTAMVIGAVAAVMTAVGRGWTQTESSQMSTGLATQAGLRVQKILRTTRQLGAYQSGSTDGSATQSAAVMLWKGDINGDNQVQFSELAVLEHNSTNHTVVYWDVEFPSNWTSAQKQAADSTLADDCMYGNTVISDFKSSANVTSTVIASHVTGAVFKRTDSYGTIRPTLEYQLYFTMSDGSTQTVYGTTAVRVPATMPASQR